MPSIFNFFKENCFKSVHYISYQFIHKLNRIYDTYYIIHYTHPNSQVARKGYTQNISTVMRLLTVHLRTPVTVTFYLHFAYYQKVLK